MILRLDADDAIELYEQVRRLRRADARIAALSGRIAAKHGFFRKFRIVSLKGGLIEPERDDESGTSGGVGAAQEEAGEAEDRGARNSGTYRSVAHA